MTMSRILWSVWLRQALLLVLLCVGLSARAAVVYQGAGNAVAGTNATGVGVAVPWPAHVQGDVALLFVESAGGEAVTLTVPSGFVAVANSPQTTGAGTAGTQLSVFWARATSAAMVAPEVSAVTDHFYAVILTFRGVLNTGNPIDVTAGGVKAAASISVSVTGVTTTVNNALVVQAVTRDTDANGVFCSAQANAGLASITERFDNGTNLGLGGGLCVWHGIRAVAGATGNTTATVASSINAFLTIALRPQPGPYFQAAGAAVNNATTANPAWPPGHAINDIALLFVESGGGEPVTLAIPNGFALVPGSPYATGAGIAGTQLTVYWARATSAAMLPPRVTVPVTVPATDGHIYARILTYRNVITAGNPWDVTGGGVKTPTSTALTLPGIATGVADTLMVQAATKDLDNTAAFASAQTNASLTGIAERQDAGTTTGRGGGIAVWDGYKAAAGATNNTTVTVTNSINAFLTIALVPQAAMVPVYNAAGTTTPFSWWPNPAINDIALLFVESPGGQPVTLSVANGFAAVTNSPQATGAGTAGTQLSVFWARASSTNMLGPTLTGPADHMYARLLTYRGAVITGNPWNITGGGVKTPASTAGGLTSVTTTTTNTRVVQAVARDNDNAAAAFSVQTNANLAPITERHDAGTAIGNGGGFSVWDGAKATASATGPTTATVTSSINAFLSIALQEAIAGPNHVELVHDGSAVTCTPRAVTVRACTTAASCEGVPANYFVGTFPITMTAIAGANWCSDSLCATALASPATVSNGSTIYLREPTVRIDRMAGTASTATTTTIQCSNTATVAAMNATTECDVSYADSGLFFDVQDHRAEALQNVNVSAVKKSDSSLACVPAFASVNKSVNFKCSYTNPVSGTRAVRVGGVALNAGNNAGAACDGTGGNVTLAFNVSGVAATTVQYADVGSMSLSATYTGSGADAGLSMTGSDSFIAAPNDFAVTTTGPYAAGSAFSATVTARNTGGTATPNFGLETPTAESASFSLGARVEPSGANDCVNGPCDGTVGGSVTLPWSAGAASASNVTYSEVGTMTLTATLASGSYLASGLNVSGTSATSGAFLPAYFDTAVTQGCVAGSFTYSGQPFTVAVTARNASGGTTRNYSNLGVCSVCSKAVTLSDPSATANFNSTNTIAATAFAAGVGSKADVAYTFPTKATAPATITLRAVDTSSVTSSGHTEGTAPIRSGRLRLSNAVGSPLLALAIPAETQYYNGSYWTINALDSCSTTGWTVSPAGANALQGSGASGSTTGTLGASVASGVATFSASAPGSGGFGYRDFSVTVPDYLKFSWTGGAAVSPGARASFGIHRGNNRIIDRRERY
jgi:hypothetical protein